MRLERLGLALHLVVKVWVEELCHLRVKHAVNGEVNHL